MSDTRVGYLAFWGAQLSTGRWRSRFWRWLRGLCRTCESGQMHSGVWLNQGDGWRWVEQTHLCPDCGGTGRMSRFKRARGVRVRVAGDEQEAALTVEAA